MSSHVASRNVMTCHVNPCGIASRRISSSAKSYVCILWCVVNFGLASGVSLLYTALFKNVQPCRYRARAAANGTRRVTAKPSIFLGRMHRWVGNPTKGNSVGGSSTSGAGLPRHASSRRNSDRPTRKQPIENQASWFGASLRLKSTIDIELTWQ